MQIRRWNKIAWTASLAMSALLAATWWIGQRPYITPGAHKVFRVDLDLPVPVVFVEFFWCVTVLAAMAVGLFSVFFCLNDRNWHGEAAHVGKACAWIVLPYMAALMVVSMLTPRTIVSVGDGYCWDLWCVGVEQVNATPEGKYVLYTANVRIFSDANRLPTSRDKNFLYALDDRGRRYPVFQNSSALQLDAKLLPRESAKTSLSFLAPAGARKLYLAGGEVEMPWVYLYFGSDLNPLHRRTLLRIS